MRIAAGFRTAAILGLTAVHVATSTAYAFDFNMGGAEKVQVPALTSEYIYRNDTEEALIPIYLLGAVSKPGLYHIPGHMDVLGLLTLAGGTLMDAEIDHILIRGQSAGTAPAHKFTFDLGEVVHGGDMSRVGLVSNDLVYVPPGKPPATFTGTLLTVVTITVGILSIVATSLLINQSLNK